MKNGLKIGLVSPYDFSFPGGVNNHITHLARCFIDWGHEVKILAPCSQKKNGDHPCEVISIGRPVPLSAIGTVARIPISPWLPFQVAWTLQRSKFDILHIHEPLIPLLPLCVLNNSNCVNVGTFHACHDKPRFYWFAGRYLRRCLPRLQGKIAVSQAALQFISRHLPGDYCIIPNGIDTGRFTPDHPRRPEFNDGKKNILFVGRLEKRKGLDYLIHAYAGVKEKLPDTRLIIVGSGTKKSGRYKEMIADMGLQDVVFTGYVGAKDLPSYYRSADVFCAPATNGESFGIVLLEAMACGTPVVAFNNPGYASVLSHEKEGFLVEARDGRALAWSLLAMLENGSLRQEMGRQGLRKAQDYSWQNIARRVMECYEESLLSVRRKKLFW